MMSMMSIFSMRMNSGGQLAAALGLLSCLLCQPTAAAPQDGLYGVARQPFEASVQRLVQALELAGSPLPAETLKQIEQLSQSDANATVVNELQELLDPHCLLVVSINPESRVKVARGEAPATLDQYGWTNFLVKVINEAGVTAPLDCPSPQARPMVVRSSSAAAPELKISPAEAARRWLDIASDQPADDGHPLRPGSRVSHPAALQPGC